MGELILVKVCAKCGNEKPIDEFYRSRKSKDGHHSYCKECQRSVHLKWLRENRSKSKKHSLSYYYRNKEERMAYQTDYRQNRKRLHVHSYTNHYPEKYPLASSCEFCGRTEKLRRHHPDYDFIGIYLTCCRQCHWWVHNG